jgi:hypothetical protein
MQEIRVKETTKQTTYDGSDKEEEWNVLWNGLFLVMHNLRAHMYRSLDFGFADHPQA